MRKHFTPSPDKVGTSIKEQFGITPDKQTTMDKLKGKRTKAEEDEYNAKEDKKEREVTPRDRYCYYQGMLSMRLAIAEAMHYSVPQAVRDLALWLSTDGLAWAKGPEGDEAYEFILPSSGGFIQPGAVMPPKED